MIFDNNIAYVGITDYAQGELGDVIFVELPEVNEEFKKNDVFGAIEAVKTVADLFMPVSSKIIEINPDLEDNPDLINTSSQDKGWIVKLELIDKSELDSLLSIEEYNDLIK